MNMYGFTLVVFLSALVTMLAAAVWTGREPRPLLRPVPDPAGSVARCERDPWAVTVPFPVADDWVAWSDIRAGWAALERQQRGWSA
jgi:hypothetical protein